MSGAKHVSLMVAISGLTQSHTNTEKQNKPSCRLGRTQLQELKALVYCKILICVGLSVTVVNLFRESTNKNKYTWAVHGT